MTAILTILAPTCISVSELKKNPSAAIDAASKAPIAILNHNRPIGYLVSAAQFEQMLETIDDIELATQAKRRMGKPTKKVTIDGLKKQAQQRAPKTAR